MPKIIKIKGIIGFGEEATPKHLGRELESAAGQDVVLEINSPGGSVVAGLEMANQVRRYSGQTTALVVGMAGSMASYIPMFANRMEVEDNAVFYIHNPFGMEFGDHRNMDSMRSLLLGMTVVIAQAYAAKTGKPMAKIRELMDAESSFFGSGIVDQGFADEVVGEETGDDADAMIAAALEDINACSELMREESRTPGQMDQIAAFFGEPPMLPAPVAKTDVPKPAPARDNPDPKSELEMTLEQFLAANPEAKTQYDAAVQAAVDKAVTAAAGGDDAVQAAKRDTRAEMSAILAKVAPILGSASYPQSAKDRVMARVATGSMEQVEDAIVLFDMGIEARKEDDAQGEQGPDTPAQGADPAADSEAALQAKLDRTSGRA